MVASYHNIELSYPKTWNSLIIKPIEIKSWMVALSHNIEISSPKTWNM